MKSLILAAVVAASLSATKAEASVLYDTLNGMTPAGLYPIGSSIASNHPWVGASFQATAGTLISQINIDLAAATPSDGGSLLVYIVPDDLVNGLTSPHLPTYSGTPGPAWSNSSILVGATLLGTIADSSLTTSATVKSLSTSYTIGTSQEYWLMIAASGSTSSGEIQEDVLGSAGVGTSGQLDSFVNAGHTQLKSVAIGSQDYMLSIITGSASQPAPEPSSLLIVGVSLAGLIWLRRRSGSHAAGV